MVLNLCFVGPKYFIFNVTRLTRQSKHYFMSLKLNQKFLSCMAFIVYEVIRVACLSRGWFAYATFPLGHLKQTNYVTDKPCKQLGRRQPYKRKPSACWVDFSSLVGKRKVGKSCMYKKLGYNYLTGKGRLILVR